MIQVEITRVQKTFGFEAKDANGHFIRMDSSLESGGNNFGLRPMQLLLMGLGGCGGIDIIAILEKQKQEVKSFRMLIKGEREQDKQPSLWKSVHIDFYFEGRIEKAKAERAVNLSMEKYCSVAETLRKAGCMLSWTVNIKEM